MTDKPTTANQSAAQCGFLRLNNASSKVSNNEAPTEPTISDGEKADRLEALGIAIAEKRKEAVDARRNSGIEDIWLYCEGSLSRH